MIHFAPKDKRAFRNMYKRVGILLLFIFLLLLFYLPNFTVYGGIGFVTYEEAFSYFEGAMGKMLKSLISGNAVLLPIKLVFLPFLFAWNCHRPGCASAGLLFIVVYYTFIFYVTILLTHKLSKKSTNR